MRKKVVIIGAGIAGLTAGIQAQEAGLSTIICEKNSVAGGKWGGFSQKNQIINYLPRFVWGINSHGQFIYQPNLFNEPLKYRSSDCLLTYYDQETNFCYYKNIDKLKMELLKIAPEDYLMVEEFISYVKAGQRFHILSKKPISVLNFLEAKKEQVLINFFSKATKKIENLNVRQYISRFHNQTIQKVLVSIMNPETSCPIFFAFLGHFSNNQIQVIDNGQDLIEKLKQKYLDLGGEIIYNQEALEFVFYKPNIIKEIKTTKNNPEGDYFIATCDPFFTFEKLLKGKYRDRRYYIRYEDPQKYPVYSALIVTFQMSSFLENRFVISIPQVRIATQIHQSLTFIKHGGNNIYSCIIEQNSSDYEFWKEINNNKNLLKETESKIWDLIQRSLFKYIEKYKINLVHFIQPVNFENEHYSYQGSLYGFNVTPLGKNIIHDGFIPSLNNLLLACSWQQSPGTITDSIISANFAVQHILKLEKKKSKESISIRKKHGKES